MRGDDKKRARSKDTSSRVEPMVPGAVRSFLTAPNGSRRITASNRAPILTHTLLCSRKTRPVSGEGRSGMTRVIDLECYAPASLSDPDYHAIERGRPGTPFPEPLERPAAYGFANYQHVFQASSTQRPSVETVPDDGGMEKLVADMDHAGSKLASWSARATRRLRRFTAIIRAGS